MLGDYAHLRLKHKFENFTHFAAREKTTANYHISPTSMHQRHQVLNGRAAAFSFFAAKPTGLHQPAPPSQREDRFRRALISRRDNDFLLQKIPPREAGGKGNTGVAQAAAPACEHPVV